MNRLIWQVVLWVAWYAVGAAAAYIVFKAVTA